MAKRTLQRDVRLKGSAYLQAPFYFWFGERALGRLIDSRRIELVHAHWLLPNGFLALLFQMLPLGRYFY